MPMIFSTAAMKSAPLLASRGAAVASTWTNATFIRSIRTRKRRSAVRAEATACGSRRPVVASPRARPRVLLVEERRRRAAQALVDDETDRVRADVDDRDRPGAIEATRRILDEGSPRSQTRLACWRQGFGRAGLDRLAASGEAGIGHEIFVRIERRLALLRRHAHRAAVREHRPALLVVGEVGRAHDLVENCSCTVGFRMGTMASTRRSRLRGIMSAEPI